MFRVVAAQSILRELPTLELKRFQYRNEADHESLTITPDVTPQEMIHSIHIEFREQAITVTLLQELVSGQGFQTIRRCENQTVESVLHFLDFWCPAKPVVTVLQQESEQDSEIPF